MDNSLHKEISPAGTSNSTQSKAHAEVFNNPDEYLAVLQQNFSSLAHGHNSLSLPDLKLDANDRTLSPQVREAAAISATHYKDLIDMKNESANDGLSETNGFYTPDTLTAGKIDFIRDIADKKILRDAALATVADVGLGGMLASGTALLGGAAYVGLADGTSLAATAAAVGTMGVEGAAIAVGSGLGVIVGAGVSAYFLYRGATDYSRLSDLSRKETNQIGSWLK